MLEQLLCREAKHGIYVHGRTVVSSSTIDVDTFFAFRVRDTEVASTGITDVPLRLGHVRVVPQLQICKGSE